MRVLYILIGMLSLPSIFAGKEFMVATICDGESGTLSCPVGSIISLVWANYGRVHPDTCTEEGQTINTTCKADVADVMIQVSESCIDEPSCTLKASTAFGDPPECRGLTKYLQVYYLCKSEPKFGTVCEFAPPKNISCSRPEEAIEIAYAKYGRLSRKKCGMELAINTRCRSTTSDQIVKEMCNGKQSCLLDADNAVLGGNPCGITHKYLSVQYYCVSGGTEGAEVAKRGSYLQSTF